MRLPIAPEGRGYVLGSLAAATSLFVLGGRAARRIGLGVLSLSAGLAWFFRDPDRYVIPIDDGVLAPADGQVIRIDSVEVPELFPGPVRRVSIFMSLMDCHVNRSPVDATVRYKATHAGGFRAAWDDRASEENRRATLGFEGSFPSGMRQVAGLVARQIVTRPEPGMTVRQGERIGIIKFGSRVDVFFPLEMELMVDLGERTVAGVTAIAQKQRSR
jgi:phosphatidylserine decarboxylase